MRKPYRSDLTDAQWELVRPLIPPAKRGGRPRTVDMREVVNTLFYQARTGVQWEFLPHDLRRAPGHFLRRAGAAGWRGRAECPILAAARHVRHGRGLLPEPRQAGPAR